VFCCLKKSEPSRPVAPTTSDPATRSVHVAPPRNVMHRLDRRRRVRSAEDRHGVDGFQPLTAMGAVIQVATKDNTAPGVVPTILDVNFFLGGFEWCCCNVGRGQMNSLNNTADNQNSELPVADWQMTSLNSSIICWGAGDWKRRMLGKT
jgi:hypothetical protein